MILYVGFAQPEEWHDWAATYDRHTARFAEVAGDVCALIPYHQFTAEHVGRVSPWAVVLSGFARSFENYPAGAFDGVAEWLVHGAPVPTLAICGSHQLLGFVFNGQWQPGAVLHDQPMRRRRPEEPVADPRYHPEYFMERGFYPMTVAAPDPLFDACGRPPVFKESHYCEVKVLPDGFRLLASTQECLIQAMRHVARPLVGVQFHPEDYTQEFPDGRSFLEAFFREARTFASLSKRGVH